MTTIWRDKRIGQSRCRQCDHDLIAREDGCVYCSNSRCGFHRRAHPTKATVNAGGRSGKPAR